MVAPTLTMEQYQFGDSGVKLNDDVALPFFDVTRISGLDNTEYRSNSHDREGMDGGFVDAEFETTRTVVIEGTIYTASDNMEAYLDLLKANFAPSRTVKPLYFRTDGIANQDRLVYGKSLGIRFAKEWDRSLGIIKAQVQVQCEDPRIYAVDLTSQTLGGTLTLEGNRDSTGTITIAGARTNPVITKGTSVLTFATTVALGHTLVIDLYNKTVILDGTTNVRNTLTVTGGWPVLQPGANVFTLGGTGTGVVTVAARSAWR